MRIIKEHNSYKFLNFTTSQGKIDKGIWKTIRRWNRRGFFKELSSDSRTIQDTKILSETMNCIKIWHYNKQLTCRDIFYNKAALFTAFLCITISRQIDGYKDCGKHSWEIHGSGSFTERQFSVWLQQQF